LKKYGPKTGTFLTKIGAKEKLRVHEKQEKSIVFRVSQKKLPF